MLVVAILFRRSLADWRPIAAVMIASVAGEVWDLIDTLDHGGRPRWSGNWKDIWNTMFWPAILFALARFTRVLKR
jgi:cell shape-determining protein MreD